MSSLLDAARDIITRMRGHGWIHPQTNSPSHRPAGRTHSCSRGGLCGCSGSCAPSSSNATRTAMSQAVGARALVASSDSVPWVRVGNPPSSLARGVRPAVGTPCFCYTPPDLPTTPRPRSSQPITPGPRKPPPGPPTPAPSRGRIGPATPGPRFAPSRGSDGPTPKEGPGTQGSLYWCRDPRDGFGRRCVACGDVARPTNPPGCSTPWHMCVQMCRSPTSYSTAPVRRGVIGPDGKCHCDGVPNRQCDIYVLCEYMFKGRESKTLRDRDRRLAEKYQQSLQEYLKRLRFPAVWWMHCLFVVVDGCKKQPPVMEWHELSYLQRSGESEGTTSKNGGVPLQQRGGPDDVTLVYRGRFSCNGAPEGGSKNELRLPANKCECIAQASSEYGYSGKKKYRWSGPNSNTYVATVAEQCGIGKIDFPPEAVGSDWTPCIDEGGKSVPRDDAPRWRAGGIPPPASWKCAYPTDK